MCPEALALLGNDSEGMRQKGQAVEQLLEWRGTRAANARQLNTAAQVSGGRFCYVGLMLKNSTWRTPAGIQAVTEVPDQHGPGRYM